MPRKTNFTANGNDYFRVTATVGKNADGSPIRKQFYGSSKKEAESKRDEYLNGIRQGLTVGYDKTTFGVAFKHWLEHVQRPAIRISTYTKYETLHRLHIATGSLVGMCLIDIKAANIQEYYYAMLKTTTAKNVYHVNKLLAVFFKYCLEDNIIIRNPLLAVKLPEIPKSTDTNTALTDADIQKLVAACKEDIKYFPFVFATFTGLRSGELLALTFKDLDFKEGMINVNKTVKYLNVDGEFKPLVSEAKTVASMRRVPILKEIQGLLQAHIQNIRQANKILSITGDFLLFPSATGTYREHCNFLQAFKRLCARLGIEEGCTIHSLRHTFCTILARQGVSLLDASRLMGHSNVNITAKIYSHVSDNEKKSAIQKLAAYF